MLLLTENSSEPHIVINASTILASVQYGKYIIISYVMSHLASEIDSLNEKIINTSL